MATELRDRVASVTGGTSGIGRDAAVRGMEAGDKVSWIKASTGLATLLVVPFCGISVAFI